MQAEIDYTKNMWNIKDSLQPTAKTREKKKEDEMDQSGRNCITWWGLIIELATSSHERPEGLDMFKVLGEITSQNLYTQLIYSWCDAVCIVTVTVRKTVEMMDAGQAADGICHDWH